MSRPRTLFGRLLLLFLVFGGVMAGAQVLVMNVSHNLYHRQLDQVVHRDLAQRYVDSNFLLVDQPLNAATLHRGIRKLAAANPKVDIYLVDSAGGIVAASVPEQDWLRRRIDIEPLRQFLDGQALPIFGQDPADPSALSVFSAAPVAISECPASYLYMLLRSEQLAPVARQLRTAYKFSEGAGVLILVAAFAIGLSVWVLRLLTRRLGKLAGAMQRFEASTGDDPRALPDVAAGGDEIDRLETLFHGLASRVQQQMEALRGADQMRRQILANVSHDLRTPLTTLLMHLESLQSQAASLSGREREDYLQVALRQTRRVIDLVEQLLEAAKLESGQVTADIESFPVAELLQDVTQKFSLAARERGIDLRLELASRVLWVEADVSLLERVLDNLIDNALRHTPAGGRVLVGLEDRQPFLRISVADTGEGMSEEVAARAFERFYRKDVARSAPAGHAGLGLAIVRAILELHGSRIQVESAPGRGARFFFELPQGAAPSGSVPQPGTDLPKWRTASR